MTEQPKSKRPSVRPPRPACTQHPHKRETPARRSRLALGGVVGMVALCVLGVCYVTMWRSVRLSVNGGEVAVRVNASLSDLLEQNGYFDVAPGRLMSIGGNVIDAKGGERCTVTVDGQPVAASALSSTVVKDGAEVTVANGADVTESYSEEEVTVAPDVEMGKGGAVQYVSQWGKPGKKTVRRGKTSGEEVDQEVLAQPQNMVVASVNLKPKGGKKYMALTFDDGPSKYTQQILDILKERGAKATFFNVGTGAQASPALSKAVLDGGNELASHTNKHQNLPALDKDALRGEITSAFDLLKDATGENLQMIRAPYGAFTATEWARSADLISCNVLWNIDTLDWKRPGADAIVNGVLSHAYNGAIALMHDGGGNREQDIEALPRIIDGLHQAGYELVTVGELMQLDGTIPADVVNGTVKMPKDAVLPEK